MARPTRETEQDAREVEASPHDRVPGRDVTLDFDKVLLSCRSSGSSWIS
jgi:hypothetical protein